jgi:3-oxoacyl-[acyl-carrier protein] reductase
MQSSQLNKQTQNKSQMSLTGKVAIVTGSSRGIGKAIALRLARDGASVVINFSGDSTPGEKVVETIGHDHAIAVKADITNLDQQKRLINATVERFGKIDFLINCAGTLPMLDLKNTTEQDFDKTFALNVKAPYFLTQVTFPFNISDI